MRESLSAWLSNADAARHREEFGFAQVDAQSAEYRARTTDYYISLVGELFSELRNPPGSPHDRARLGNAFSQLVPQRQVLARHGIAPQEAALFGAAAFYLGGFPASAYLTLKAQDRGLYDEVSLACYDLMVRPPILASAAVEALRESVRVGDKEKLAALEREAVSLAQEALRTGPFDWVPAKLREHLVKRFVLTNVRAVLPEREPGFWNPLVTSFLDRTPPVWEFFPSQISAIQGGLLDGSEGYSLQMPTGAGKTALCETLMFSHLGQHPTDVAILLVPYRSLAAELRVSLVRRMTEMGLQTRCAYGGTVPTGAEVQELSGVRAIVATPEALSGLMSASADLLNATSLLIVDEGHLLDGEGRGVGLELLIARLKSRTIGPPRFVFVSAIVPNIEEINAWLGGNEATVVKSDYRASIAEFAVLRPSGAGSGVALEMHPHEATRRFVIPEFLSAADFRYRNAGTGRRNTYPFTSLKAQAIATGRKAMPMGGVVVFSANKRGVRGATGLAEELLKQLERPLGLPKPIDFVSPRVPKVLDYLVREYGPDWIGTRLLTAGAVLHHGDVPQETREHLESLIRHDDVRLALCTNTLAEGVNLPIRTLVLYSIERLTGAGQTQSLLTRDIKNLVGRAGRAGVNTKGLVICVNPNQWPPVRSVALQATGEIVRGALRKLVLKLQADLAGTLPTNELLEASPDLHPLVDGVDSTLIDLSAEELGQGALADAAVRLVDQTFAARNLEDSARSLLQAVLQLRAQRIGAIRDSGRLPWLRQSGARARLIASVELGLLNVPIDWTTATSALDPGFVLVLLRWAWEQRDVQAAVRRAYRLPSDSIPPETARRSLFSIVDLWLKGERFVDIATAVRRDMDEVLSIHSQVVAYVLQTVVEQGLAILSRLLIEGGRSLSPLIIAFPEHLRFGVPSTAARILSSQGVRHRRAAVELGNAEEVRRETADGAIDPLGASRRILVDHKEEWTDRLGALVYDQTLSDLQ